MVDLNSANRGYIEGLYVQYCQDPGSLDPEWVAFFKGFTFGLLKSDEEGEEGDDSPATGPSTDREHPATSTVRPDPAETVPGRAAPAEEAPAKVAPVTPFQDR